MDEVVKLVSAGTNVVRLADSICKSITDGYLPSLICMGSDSVNQGVKALARARETMFRRGIDLTMYVYFEDIKGKKDGKEISALRFKIIVKPLKEGKE